MAIPVDQRSEVRDSSCLSCLNCVHACPAKKRERLPLHWGLRKPMASSWSQAAIILILTLCATSAVTASYLFPLPSFIKQRGTVGANPQSVDLKITDLTCRGRANLLVYFLERDDLYAIPGYCKLEAWPAPAMGRIRVTFDGETADELLIKQAITEPYYDVLTDAWRSSPFSIEGYDPLALGDDLLGEF
jgi:hypothetical protein